MIEPGTLIPAHAALHLLDKGERAVLCLLLTAMIVLACTQIVLRTFFAGGLPWADPLLRYLVLWSGLLGAVSATSQGKHIALDITGGRLPKWIEPSINLVTNVFATLAAGGLTWAGWLFLQNEFEFGGAGPLSLPLWVWNAVFPLAFGLIALKYLLLLLLQVYSLFAARPQADPGRPGRP